MRLALTFLKTLLFATAGIAAVGALNMLPLRAQSPDAPPLAFEVASIKPNKLVDGDQLLSMRPGGQFTATSVTLGNLIHFAYQIRDFQLSGGPKWLDMDRFDVVAKADGAASPTQIRLMVRALLAERFKLTMLRGDN